MATKVKLVADNSIGIAQLNVSDGTNGQVLKTNGSGTLSFGDDASASSLTVPQRDGSAVSCSLTAGSLVVVGRSGNVTVGVS